MIGLLRATREPRVGHAPREDVLADLLGLHVGSGAKTALDPELLCDVADMITSFAAGDRGREAYRVRIGDVPWELGLEWFGTSISMSLFSGGPLPIVYAHDRRTDAASLKSRLRTALEEACPSSGERCADRIV